ncbi:MAG: methyltransferase domain-containing protein [Gemmataceae bacterium]|nr:methyltransferase domain-containing protein [Gemmataceae bacterium]
MCAFLPETPPDALGPTVQQAVTVAGRSFTLVRPDAVDRLIDHPSFISSTAADEYLPHWASLWPGARMLAEVVLAEPWAASNGSLTALELGCGLGLVGIAALARGLRVVFSDYDATALRFAADGARLNGFTDFQVLQMDWRCPPADFQVPIVLAADVAYERTLHVPLATLIRKVLAPGGVCLLADKDRAQAPHFREALVGAGLSFQCERLHLEGADGTLYRITYG